MRAMNRRELLQLALLANPLAHDTSSHVDVPILCITNKHARCSGITLRLVERAGEILKYPSGRPRPVGLEYGKLNVVLTDYIPPYWDNAHLSAGVAGVYEGYHLCAIAMNLAHGHRVPFLAVNTVVHELLHIFLQDIFFPKSGILRAHTRDTRVDWYGTRMWLFNDGAAVRDFAREYLKRLPVGA